jgi:hypothetical protein
MPGGKATLGRLGWQVGEADCRPCWRSATRWYRLLTAGEEIPAVGYRAGVYGRNLLPDLLAVLAELGGLLER